MRRMADQGANEQDKHGELTFWQVLKSTIAGALGVQSRAHRERDFAKGKGWQFIAMGIGFTITFVLTLVIIVQAILATAG